MAKTFPNIGLLIFRVLISSMMLFHGIPKIEKLFSLPISFADPLGVGSTTSLILTLIGEVLAPIFIIVGFKTRWASIPAAITMAVSAFVVHADDSFYKKEKAILYLVCFVTIGLLGPGKYAINKK